MPEITKNIEIVQDDSEIIIVPPPVIPTRKSRVVKEEDNDVVKCEFCKDKDGAAKVFKQAAYARHEKTKTHAAAMEKTQKQPDIIEPPKAPVRVEKSPVQQNPQIMELIAGTGTKNVKTPPKSQIKAALKEQEKDPEFTEEIITPHLTQKDTFTQVPKYDFSPAAKTNLPPASRRRFSLLNSSLRRRM